MSSHNKSTAEKYAAGKAPVAAWVEAKWAEIVKAEAARRGLSLAGLVTEWAQRLEKIQSRRNRQGKVK